MDKQTFASSAMWKMIEALSTKGIALVISIVLARILLPEDYGIVTLTAIFINLSTIFVQSGLSTALIRREKVDEVDYNNGFFMGFTIALVCYVVFFVCAPLIAQFYSEPLLIPVLRVQMLSLFLVAFGNIQTVIITREFRFKELCVANIIANSISGVVGVLLAYLGFGVWALVLYTLLRDGISSFVVFIRIKWYPSLKIDRSKMKNLLGFSVWVLAATLIDFIGNNYSSTLLGRKYSLAELGLYTKGNQVPEMICLYTFGAISSVLLPTLSIYQNDHNKLKDITRRLVEMTCYIILPMMVGLALVADKLVPFLFTEKWNASIPVFVCACVYFGVNPLRTVNMQLLYALGKSRKAVYIELLRAALLIIGVTICAFVLHTSIYGIACVSAAVSVINVLVTQMFVQKEIGYMYFEWFKDILVSAMLCMGMAIAVILVGLLPINRYVLMFIQIVVGIGVYVVLSLVSKNESFYEAKDIAIQKLKNASRGF